MELNALALQGRVGRWRTTTTCAKRAYGADANSALNRGKGAELKTYLRQGQLLGLSESQALVAVSSSPVVSRNELPDAAFLDALGEPERFSQTRPSYEDFERALLRSGAVRRLAPCDVATAPTATSQPAWAWQQQQTAPSASPAAKPARALQQAQRKEEAERAAAVRADRARELEAQRSAPAPRQQPVRAGVVRLSTKQPRGEDSPVQPLTPLRPSNKPKQALKKLKPSELRALEAKRTANAPGLLPDWRREG